MSFQNKDLRTIFKLIIPIILGLLFFLGALAWNDALRQSINFYFSDRDFLKPTNKELISTWVYVIILTVLFLLYLWFFRNQLKNDVVQFEPHDAPGAGIDIGADTPAVLPVSQQSAMG